MFLDSFNGFGGIAASALNLIKEEFPKKSIFSILPFPDFRTESKETQMTKLINTAFSFKDLVEDNKDLIKDKLANLVKNKRKTTVLDRNEQVNYQFNIIKPKLKKLLFRALQ